LIFFFFASSETFSILDSFEPRVLIRLKIEAKLHNSDLSTYRGIFFVTFFRTSSGISLLRARPLQRTSHIIPQLFECLAWKIIETKTGKKLKPNKL